MTATALVQILLPLNDNDQVPHPSTAFVRVRQDLVDYCGGVTAQLAAPAQGVWREEDNVLLDSVVVFEAMVEQVDRAWWAAYRSELEQRFRQQEVVIRAVAIERL